VPDQALLVAQRALAVVVEVGLDALGESKVLVALGRNARELVDRSRSLGLRLLVTDLRLRELVAHDLVASSSSMTS
jgi:hypothetical protein